MLLLLGLLRLLGLHYYSSSSLSFRHWHSLSGWRTNAPAAHMQTIQEWREGSQQWKANQKEERIRKVVYYYHDYYNDYFCHWRCAAAAAAGRQAFACGHKTQLVNEKEQEQEQSRKMHDLSQGAPSVLVGLCVFAGEKAARKGQNRTEQTSTTESGDECTKKKVREPDKKKWQQQQQSKALGKFPSQFILRWHSSLLLLLLFVLFWCLPICVWSCALAPLHCLTTAAAAANKIKWERAKSFWIYAHTKNWGAQFRGQGQVGNNLTNQAAAVEHWSIKTVNFEEQEEEGASDK